MTFQTMYDRFASQAVRTPDNIAVTFESARLTYRELAERAHRVAVQLRTRGVKPETLVGVAMDRSLELVVALYGIVGAGAAYVPLDPSYPQERLRYMIDDASASIVLAQQQVAAWQAEPVAQTLPPPVLDAESLAYVIYTSGSTGRPKGAMNRHVAIVNRLEWMQDAYPIGPGDVVLQKTPYSFDVSVWEFFWPLMTGATLAVARPDGHKDPAYLAELIERERVTTLHFVPSMLSVFLETAPVERCRSIKQVIVSGEALPLALTQRFHARMPWAALHNLYGPTEAAVDVTAYTCRWDESSIPIGKAITAVQLHVLDAELRRLPVGQTGELYIAGIGLGRGYWRRPDLTAERFVPDPFGPTGSRMYRTGDLAFQRHDGEIEYQGRSDHQVKISGFRIELGEIEETLRRHPGVRDALVVVHEPTPGDKRLAAYVAAPVERTAPDDLRARLRATLPEHMVPTSITVLDAFPVTPNGKLDRAALPAPATIATGAAELPRGPLETSIAAAVGKLLGVDEAGVGLHADLFELGASSLTAIRLVAKLRSMFDVELTLGELFAAPTVAGIASLVSQRGADAPVRDPQAQSPIPRVSRSEHLPASSGQERVWFVERMLRPGGPRPLNVSLAIAMTGEIDAGVLARCASEIIARHESWRTNLRLVDRKLVQVIAEPYQVELPVAPQGELTGAPRAERITALARDQAREPFDLANGRVVRWQLVRFAPDDHVLLVCVHHTMYDGASIGVLVGDLAALYDALEAGAASPLAALPAQYADIAAWQRAAASSERVQKDLAYWTSRLTGAPIVDLPADRPRPTTFKQDGSQLRVELARDVTKAAREFSKREGVSLFVTLLAAFGAQLARRTGLADLVVGTAVTLRTRPELEAPLGMLVNMVALRLDASGDPTFRELVKHARSVVVEALAHRDVPFESVVQALKPKHDRGLFQVAMTLNTLPTEVPAPPGQTWRIELPDTGAVLDDLGLELNDDGADVFGALAYRTDLFERSTVEGFLEEYQTMLRLGLDAPERPLSELRRRPVHAQIHDRALATPNAVALVYGDTSVTYAELDRRANQLANALRARAVGPESLVAISLERSPELIIAMLGVLAAGGAYVPVDPHYPPERVKYMLDDARPVLVLGRPDLAPSALAAHSSDPPVVDVSPDNLAYVIYTSGSTGRPKGTLLRHGGLDNLVANERELFELGPSSRVLQFASISFDASVWETFATLVAGGTLVLASPDELLAGRELVDTLRRHAVTLATLPPSVLAVLRDTSLPELRTIVSAGEAVSAAVGERWASGRRFVNAYGPTESTVCATCADVLPGGRITIGGPLRGIAVYVLDDRLQRVSPGSSGELYIGGAGLARGYHGRPELTAEKFVPDPFSTARGARMYRTGDHVKLLDDDCLEFIGRRDDQVKIRGFRIELGEVEAVLREHPAVRHAVCAARGASVSEQRLLAYVIPASKPFDTAAVTAFLGAKLPAHMVPSAIVVVDAYPMTPAGKVDRNALGNEPVAAASSTASTAITASTASTASTDVASRLAALFAEALEVPTVGINDNFFEIGGHSLLAAHVISRIAEELGVELPLRTIFDNPTAVELALALPADTPAPAAMSPVVSTLIALFAEVLEVPTLGPDDNFFEQGGHSILAAHLVGRIEEQLGVELPLRDLFDAPTPRALAERVSNAGEP